VKLLNRNHAYIAVAVLAAATAVGCGGSEGDDTGAPGPRIGKRMDPALLIPPTFSNVPGLPGTPQVTDADKLFRTEAVTVAGRYGGPRSDPFSLKASERTFETFQNTERIVGEMGSWTVMFTPPVEKDPLAGVITEPQPYRRLSGIIVGDSVYAILDEGDGTPEIIRPGMRIPNSEWTVVSIDEEKAVLRRSGNKLPKQIIVRLESPPGGVPSMGGGQPGGQPGGPPGGFPGGMPGGPPGRGKPGSGPGPGGNAGFDGDG
jgi:hypothetical protein